jgi:threonine dehydratase
MRAGAQRLEGVVHRTPLIRSRALDESAVVRALVKGESLQHTGSFKFRGAYNKIVSIAPGDRERGVLAFSSGNHAQAVPLRRSVHDPRSGCPLTRRQ